MATAVACSWTRNRPIRSELGLARIAFFGLVSIWMVPLSETLVRSLPCSWPVRPEDSHIVQTLIKV
jgi:hypothetical protein